MSSIWPCEDTDVVVKYFTTDSGVDGAIFESLDGSRYTILQNQDGDEQLVEGEWC
jgi:hypothetical protein